MQRRAINLPLTQLASLVASLALAGQMISRTLSYEGASFDMIPNVMDEDVRNGYGKACDIWSDVLNRINGQDEKVRLVFLVLLVFKCLQSNTARFAHRSGPSSTANSTAS